MEHNRALCGSPARKIPPFHTLISIVCFSSLVYLNTSKPATQPLLYFSASSYTHTHIHEEDFLFTPAHTHIHTHERENSRTRRGYNPLRHSRITLGYIVRTLSLYLALKVVSSRNVLYIYTRYSQLLMCRNLPCDVYIKYLAAVCLRGTRRNSPEARLY